MQRKLTTTIPALLAVSALIVGLALTPTINAPKNTAVLEHDAKFCLESLNRRNSSAKSVFCPSIRTGIASKSSLFYRKNDKIALSNWFLGINEAIVGLDGPEYWFWMRSFDAKSIYFCNSGRLDKTTLRPIMRPEVIAMIAWIAEIENPQKINKSARGFVTHVTSGSMDLFIEFDDKKILAQSAFLNGMRIVTLEGENFSESSGVMVPGKIRATWHEEKVSGEFVVDKWIVNADDPGMSPPEGLKRVNLEDYSSSARKSVSVSFAPIPDGP